MNATNDEHIKILLVDDEADDQELFKEALAHVQPGAELIAIRNGEEFITYLNQVTGELPHIIFLDIYMPGISGKECLSTIRSNAKFAQVMVIMFSSLEVKEIIEDSLKNGANLFIKKPVKFEESVKMLKRVLAMNWQQEHGKPQDKRMVL
jgi:CheY-like chemotaxis protein